MTAPKIARVGTSYTVNVLLTEQRNSIQTGSIVFTHEKDKSQMKTVAFSVDPAGKHACICPKIIFRGF